MYMHIKKYILYTSIYDLYVHVPHCYIKYMQDRPIIYCCSC